MAYNLLREIVKGFEDMIYNGKEIAAWIGAFCDEIVKKKGMISDLDSAVGDSDHGFNLARAIALYRKDDPAQAGNPSEVIGRLGKAMLFGCGGTSGALYGQAFAAMAKSLAGKATIDPCDLSIAVAEGLKTIERLGRSHEGEKTMDDVWGPVSRDLEAHRLPSVSDIDRYVAATVPMKATKGRASYLGERSIGHVDPGAYSSGIFFKTMVHSLTSVSA